MTGRLAAAFLKAHLIDQLVWFRAGCALGADARPGIGALDITRLADAPRFTRTSAMTLGGDTLELFDRRRRTRPRRSLARILPT